MNTFERPPFDQEKEEQKPSNVVEGPWMEEKRRQEEEDAAEEEEIRQMAQDLEGLIPKEKPLRDNVIEGPWPKPEEAAQGPDTVEVPVEDTPLEIPEGSPVEVPIEPVSEAEETQIEKAREDLQTAFSEQEQSSSEGSEPKEGGEGKSNSFVEMYTTYKPCEVCKGRKRRWLFFPCPACKGMGRVPDKTTVMRGVM